MAFGMHIGLGTHQNVLTGAKMHIITFGLMTPIASKCYSITAQIIANHSSLLQSQVNVSMTVRLLHRFVRHSWHPKAQIMFLNHRKKVNSYQTTSAEDLNCS